MARNFQLHLYFPIASKCKDIFLQLRTLEQATVKSVITERWTSQFLEFPFRFESAADFGYSSCKSDRRAVLEGDSGGIFSLYSSIDAFPARDTRLISYGEVTTGLDNFWAKSEKRDNFRQIS